MLWLCSVYLSGYTERSNPNERKTATGVHTTFWFNLQQMISSPSIKIKCWLANKQKWKGNLFFLQILTDSVIRITAWTVSPYISSPLRCSVNNFNMDDSSLRLATCWTTRSQIPKEKDFSQWLGFILWQSSTKLTLQNMKRVIYKVSPSGVASRYCKSSMPCSRTRTSNRGRLSSSPILQR